MIDRLASPRLLVLLLLAASPVGCGKKGIGGAPAPRAPAPSASTGSRRPGATPQLLLPRSFQLDFVWLPAAGVAMPRDLRLRAGSNGRPVLLHGAAFLPLPLEPGDRPASAFRIGAIARPDDAIWTDDGAMLLIHGRQLSVATPGGLRSIQELPAPSMHLAPAGRGKCWLFGGAGATASRLFLYDSTGTVLPYFDAEGPITAVSGSPESVHVAAQGIVLRIAPSEGVFALYQGTEPVRALAVAPGVGVVFSTASGVFFLREDGLSVRLGDQSAAELHVRGDDLYVLYEGVGIARGRPLSSLGPGAGG